MLEPQLGMGMDQLVETSMMAERLGFGYMFRSDHLLPTDDRRGIDSPECWTSLGAIAQATGELKFGPMVSPIGFRNPAMLAKMACTLHSLSLGRLQLGVGAGWYEPEYRAYGYRFPTFAQRLGEFREALDIIIALVRKGSADFDGKYFSAHTDCLPRPAGEMNIIIGAKSRPLVRLAASLADEWNIFVAPREDYLKLKESFDGASDGRKVRVSETGPFLIGRNNEDLQNSARMQAKKRGAGLSSDEIIRRLKEENSPCGTVEGFVEHLRAKLDVGIEKFYFQALVPENREMLELLSDTLRAGV